jgi:hypothetical protein
MIIRAIGHANFAAAIAATKTPRQPLNAGDRCARGGGAVCQGFLAIKINHGKGC